MVAITIVTFNSAEYIANCLKYVFEQDYSPFEVIVVDNDSRDGTPEILQRYEGRVRVFRNHENTGFAAAQNQAIASTQAPWVLTLNPDVRLTRDFITRLLAAVAHHESIGSVCGKLLVMRSDFEIPGELVFDSTGIYMTPNFRHLDRGSRVADLGQYEEPEYVFGATGAACLYRRAMIEDISIGGEFFDTDFFAYREDADIAWRAQLLGWKCLYVPSAVAYHVRSVLPSSRSSVPAVLNMHSVKNRFLLRIKNATTGVYKRYWVPVTVRDLLVIAGCFFREWRSLPALWFVLRRFSATLRKRRTIMRRRRASDEYIASWFAWRPVAIPASRNALKEPHAV